MANRGHTSKIPKFKNNFSSRQKSDVPKFKTQNNESSYMQLNITKVYFLKKSKRNLRKDDNLEGSVTDLANKISTICSKIKDVESCMILGKKLVSSKFEFKPSGDTGERPDFKKSNPESKKLKNDRFLCNIKTKDYKSFERNKPSHLFSHSEFSFQKWEKAVQTNTKCDFFVNETTGLPLKVILEELSHRTEEIMKKLCTIDCQIKQMCPLKESLLQNNDECHVCKSVFNILCEQKIQIGNIAQTLKECISSFPDKFENQKQIQILLTNCNSLYQETKDEPETENMYPFKDFFLEASNEPENYKLPSTIDLESLNFESLNLSKESSELSTHIESETSRKNSSKSLRSNSNPKIKSKCTISSFFEKGKPKSHKSLKKSVHSLVKNEESEIFSRNYQNLTSNDLETLSDDENLVSKSNSKTPCNIALEMHFGAKPKLPYSKSAETTSSYDKKVHIKSLSENDTKIKNLNSNPNNIDPKNNFEFSSNKNGQNISLAILKEKYSQIKQKSKNTLVIHTNSSFNNKLTSSSHLFKIDPETQMDEKKIMKDPTLAPQSAEIAINNGAEKSIQNVLQADKMDTSDQKDCSINNNKPDHNGSQIRTETLKIGTIKESFDYLLNETDFKFNQQRCRNGSQETPAETEILQNNTNSFSEVQSNSGGSETLETESKAKEYHWECNSEPRANRNSHDTFDRIRGYFSENNQQSNYELGTNEISDQSFRNESSDQIFQNENSDQYFQCDPEMERSNISYESSIFRNIRSSQDTGFGKGQSESYHQETHCTQESTGCSEQSVKIDEGLILRKKSNCSQKSKKSQRIKRIDQNLGDYQFAEPNKVTKKASNVVQNILQNSGIDSSSAFISSSNNHNGLSMVQNENANCGTITLRINSRESETSSTKIDTKRKSSKNFTKSNNSIHSSKSPEYKITVKMPEPNDNSNMEKTSNKDSTTYHFTGNDTKIHQSTSTIPVRNYSTKSCQYEIDTSFVSTKSTNVSGTLLQPEAFSFTNLISNLEELIKKETKYKAATKNDLFYRKNQSSNNSSFTSGAETENIYNNLNFKKSSQYTTKIEDQNTESFTKSWLKYRNFMKRRNCKVVAKIRTKQKYYRGATKYWTQKFLQKRRNYGAERVKTTGTQDSFWSSKEVSESEEEKLKITRNKEKMQKNPTPMNLNQKTLTFNRVRNISEGDTKVQDGPTSVDNKKTKDCKRNLVIKNSVSRVPHKRRFFISTNSAVLEKHGENKPSRQEFEAKKKRFDTLDLESVKKYDTILAEAPKEDPTFKSFEGLKSQGRNSDKELNSAIKKSLEPVRNPKLKCPDQKSRTFQSSESNLGMTQRDESGDLNPKMMLNSCLNSKIEEIFVEGSIMDSELISGPKIGTEPKQNSKLEFVDQKSHNFPILESYPVMTQKNRSDGLNPIIIENLCQDSKMEAIFVEDPMVDPDSTKHKIRNKYYLHCSNSEELTDPPQNHETATEKILENKFLLCVGDSKDVEKLKLMGYKPVPVTKLENLNQSESNTSKFDSRNENFYSRAKLNIFLTIDNIKHLEDDFNDEIMDLGLSTVSENSFYIHPVDFELDQIVDDFLYRRSLEEQNSSKSIISLELKRIRSAFRRIFSVDKMIKILHM